MATKNKINVTEETAAKATAAKEATKEAAKAVGEVAAATVKEVSEKAAKAAKETATKTRKSAKAKADEVKEAVKAKADEVKEAPKKRAPRKPAKTVILQYLGKEIDEDEIAERAIAQFAATEGAVAVKKITLYLKPEEDAAYYVINDQFTGRVEF